jgi:hypothetical protein
MQPLVYGGDVGSDWCETRKVHPSKVKGKIVMRASEGVMQGLTVKQAGRVGAILASSVAEGKYGMP